MRTKLLKLLAVLVLFAIFCQNAAAMEITGLTWDGQEADLFVIAENSGYDLVDSAGNYKPMYAFAAEELWNNGLFLGADGSFDLNKPLTRAEGAVMVLRLLGKETEAKDARMTSGFTDVPDWAGPQIAYAVNAGIVKGYSETEFGSGDTMQANQ
jgi:hypothetical protein